MIKKNWYKRRFSTKKKNIHKILFIVVIAMTVGFAALNTTLQLIGTLNISRTTWNIHWTNPTKVGGVTATKDATLKTGDNTIVEYEVTLDNQGDYYEFTVDAQNEGTIDAMVTGIDNKVYENNVEVQKPDYLDFTVTYADGTTIANNHLLASGDSETYKVKVEYKSNLTADQLPTSTRNLKFTFQVTYMQSDEATQIERPTVTFDYNDGVTQSTTKKVMYNTTYGTLPEPTRTGYTFKGWVESINSNLPNNYLKVNYIESNNGAYVNTGYYAKNTTITDVKFKLNLPNGSVYGACEEDVNTYMLVDASNYNDKLYLYFGAGNAYSSLQYSSTDIDFSKIYTAHVEDAVATISDLGTIETNNHNSFTTNYPINIFALNENGSTTLNNGNTRIYYLKFYEGSTLVKSYVPAYDKTNNVFGLYEEVVGEFYANANLSGSFIPEYTTSSTTVTQKENHTLIAIWEQNS